MTPSALIVKGLLARVCYFNGERLPIFGEPMPQANLPIIETATSEIAILARVLCNGKDFSPVLARHLLRLGFSVEEKARINDLAVRNQNGDLSSGEQAELQMYANAGCLLG